MLANTANRSRVVWFRAQSPMRYSSSTRLSNKWDYDVQHLEMLEKRIIWLSTKVGGSVGGYALRRMGVSRRWGGAL